LIRFFVAVQRIYNLDDCGGILFPAAAFARSHLELSEPFVVTPADRFSVGRVEILVYCFDQFQLFQSGQIHEAVENNRNIVIHSSMIQELSIKKRDRNRPRSM
jgi:hypothetical protein